MNKNDKVFFYKTPKSCSFNVLIKDISCGANHSAMLTTSGHLYMMGSNKFGQLGIGTNSSIEHHGNSSKASQSLSEF
jgi:alpha-tubulin suppressor-like RCC1 family protein